MITFFATKDGEAPCNMQKQDLELTVAQLHHLLIAKFRLKVKKVGRTTRPFRHNLDQIPYCYTVDSRD